MNCVYAVCRIRGIGGNLKFLKGVLTQSAKYNYFRLSDRFYLGKICILDLNLWYQIGENVAERSVLLFGEVRYEFLIRQFDLVLER